MSTVTPAGWQQILSALIGLAVAAVTTLGPRLIRLAAGWLTKLTPPVENNEPPTPAG